MKAQKGVIKAGKDNLKYKLPLETKDEINASFDKALQV